VTFKKLESRMYEQARQRGSNENNNNNNNNKKTERK